MEAILERIETIGNSEKSNELTLPSVVESSGLVTEGGIEKSKLTLEKYEFIKIIGKGAYGKVSLCRHRETSRYYAVKVLRKNVIAREKQITHTTNEINVLKKINHPFLVALKASFQTMDRIYFVMEYVCGGELYFHLRKDLFFTEERAKFYGAEITLAIEYLHSLKIIYRDLKLENLLLDKHGHIKIVDFGLSKEQDGKTPNSFCGTPEYLAPEVLLNEAYGPAVDWWGVGVLMYEMMYGKLPFNNSNQSTLFTLIVTAQAHFPPFLSPNARDLLRQLLTKYPDHRLGCGPTGAKEILDHTFYANINWNDVIHKRLAPPYVPRITSETDTRYFDDELTEYTVSVTPPDTDNYPLSGIDESELDFPGFSFDNMTPSLDEAADDNLSYLEVKNKAIPRLVTSPNRFLLNLCHTYPDLYENLQKSAAWRAESGRSPLKSTFQIDYDHLPEYRLGPLSEGTEHFIRECNPTVCTGCDSCYGGLCSCQLCHSGDRVWCPGQYPCRTLGEPTKILRSYISSSHWPEKSFTGDTIEFRERISVWKSSSPFNVLTVLLLSVDEFEFVTVWGILHGGRHRACIAEAIGVPLANRHHRSLVVIFLQVDDPLDAPVYPEGTLKHQPSVHFPATNLLASVAVEVIKMETPLKNKVLMKLQQADGFQTPAASGAAGDGRFNQHTTSTTKLPSSPFLTKLGFGTGVEVLKVRRSQSKTSNRSPWAIKMLSRRAALQEEQINDRLVEEANILKNLSHPNIIGYRGFDTLEAGKKYIAMEYCNTSLGDLLEKRYDQNLGPLEVPKIERMALDILKALDYLHTEALILHGDLKSFNILVKNDFEICKLCDFGVSLPLTKDGFLDTEKRKDAQYVGTGIWSAPEVLEEDITLISSKADIFSFGLVIFETIALLPPHTFPGIKDESVASAADCAVMNRIIRGASGTAVNRKLDVSDVIVLEDDEDEFDEEGEDDVKEDEKNIPSEMVGVKRKHNELDDPELPAKSQFTHQPDSTTDAGMTPIADDSTIIIEDDDDDEEEEIDDDVHEIDDDEEEVFDEDEEGIEDVDEDDDYDGIDEDDVGNYLEYGRVGSRPAIPDAINISEEYFFVLEVFYVCTIEDYEARPSARTILNAWEKYNIDKGEKKTPEEQQK
ncbi:uncharacterized protein LOC129761704 [Toxorhynchites rutilus septentrionalis]|uniref:uncharacterized protein LOC129761704 n=1 Tax=Toxorhynchites rutilus septentrionalis TaxID=329112 RepID=UPI00247AB67E|nr:uncharacterized protein LOC129761704 [Toxorhynchites rutilus septentrionalis]